MTGTQGFTHQLQPLVRSQSQHVCFIQAQELVSNENILLQTLGFDVAIDHPHTHVVKCCQLVKGPLYFLPFLFDFAN